MHHILPLLDDADVPLLEEVCADKRRLYIKEFREADAPLLR